MTRPSIPTLVFVAASFLPSLSWSQPDNRIILGPRNIYLADGATAILSGDVQKGIELTLQGLTIATARERIKGLSNLCAAYIMVGNLEAGLQHCDDALFVNDRFWRAYGNRAVIHILNKDYAKAEQDLLAGLAIHPYSRKLREVKSMLLDATHPVEQVIVIDDRDMDISGKENQ